MSRPGVIRAWSRPSSGAQRTLLRAGSAAALAASLAACGTGFGAQTLKVRSPGDGTGATSGNVSVLNALVVSDGTKTTLSTTIANRATSGDPLVLQGVTIGGTQADLSGPTQVQPESTLQIGGRGGTVATVTGAQVTPGALEPITVSFSNAGPITVQVPVYMPTGYYATITPGATPGPSITANPSAIASNTPETSGGPTPGARPGAPGNDQNGSSGNG